MRATLIRWAGYLVDAFERIGAPWVAAFRRGLANRRARRAREQRP